MDSVSIAVRTSHERLIPQGPGFEYVKGGTCQAKMDSLKRGGGVQDHSEGREVVQEPVRAYLLLEEEAGEELSRYNNTRLPEIDRIRQSQELGHKPSGQAEVRHG